MSICGFKLCGLIHCYFRTHNIFVYVNTLYFWVKYIFGSYILNYKIIVGKCLINIIPSYKNKKKCKSYLNCENIS